jgi:hypothetical protein
MAGISLGPDEHLICSTQFGMLSVAVTKEQLKAQENDPDPHLLEEFDPRYHNTRSDALSVGIFSGRVEPT